MSLSPLWCCAGDMKMSASHGSRYRGFAVTNTHKKKTQHRLCMKSPLIPTPIHLLCVMLLENKRFWFLNRFPEDRLERDQTVNSGMASCTLATSVWKEVRKTVFETD